MLRCWLLQWFGKKECHVGSSYAWIRWSGPCTHACIGRVFITAWWLRGHGLHTEGRGKERETEGQVQLYLGSNIIRLWQSNACFALFCENMGGGVSTPSINTICLDPAMGAMRDSNLWKTAGILTFDICYVMVWRKYCQKCNCLYIFFFQKRPAGEWVYNGNVISINCKIKNKTL